MKHMSKLLTVALTLLALNTYTAPEAKAEGYIGGLVGLGTASGTGVGLKSGLGLGATVGYRLLPELGAAFTYLHSALQTDVGGIDVGVHQYMAEANFFSLFFMNAGLHLGAVNTTSLGFSSTDFGFGAHTGIDVKLAENVSVGAQIYYTYVTQENDKHSLFNFMVPVKFWFN